MNVLLKHVTQRPCFFFRNLQRVIRSSFFLPFHSSVFIRGCICARKYRNSFNVSATIFFYFSLFGDFQSDILFIFSETDCTKDISYTSFERPDIELSESEIKMGVASAGGLSHPLKWDYLLRATIFQG